jgi:hypothetical protein
LSHTPRDHESSTTQTTSLHLRALLLTTASVGALLTFLPGSASAEEAPTTNLTEFDQADITAAAQDGASVSSGSAADAAVTEHLEAAMRTGQLLDQNELNVASLEDPFDPEGDVTVTWSDASQITDLAVATAKVPEGDPAPLVGMGAILENVIDDEDQMVDAGTGFGLLGDAPSGFHSEGWDCAWVTRSQEGGEPHQLNTCYEKFHSDGDSQGGLPDWIYNRTSSLQLSQSIYFDYDVQDFTVRARPWAGSNQFDTLETATPTGTVENCNDQAYLNLGGSILNVQIPIGNCEELTPMHRSQNLEIGAAVFNSDRNAVDVHTAGHYKAISFLSILSWADYNWVELIAVSKTDGSEYWYSGNGAWGVDSGW